MPGLQENLIAIQAMRAQSAEKRKKRMSQLVSLVSSIPDPGADMDGTAEAMTLTAAPAPTGKHSMGDGHGHSNASEVKGLNAEFNTALSALVKASGGKVKINSGYRSVERQTQLWNEALKKYGSPEAARKWVAPPGKSNHNHGLAADLGYADAETRKWVHSNAAKYGLVFPLGNEPWHIEPVSARKKRK